MMDFLGANVDREHQLLLACAKSRLDGERLDRIRAIAESGVDWQTVAQVARRHATSPLLGASLGAAAPSDVPPAMMNSLRRRLRTTAMTNLHLANEMRFIQDQFSEKGISALFFKGPILAVDSYGGMEMRPSGDVDVLIAPEQLSAAQELLRHLGYLPFLKVQRLGPFRRALHVRLARQIPYRHPERADIDLHTGVVGLGYHFTAGFPTLYARSRSVELAGSAVRTLSVEDKLLVLCYQGVNNRWAAIKHVCDVAEHVDAHEDLDWDQMRARARQMRGQRILNHGLHLADSLIGSRLPPEIRQEVSSDHTATRISGTVARHLLSDTYRDLSFRERAAYYPAAHSSVVGKVQYFFYSIARRVVSPAV